jgi:aldose 1-epimerase
VSLRDRLPSVPQRPNREGRRRRAPRARANSVALGQRGIPIDTLRVDGTDLDFRAARPIGDAKLDTGYTDLERDHDDLARVEVRARDGRRGVTLWVDEGYPYLMVFTGDHPDVERPALAVEPMTCAPNAFQSGDGLIRLEPGASVTTTWGIAPQE